LRELQSIAKKKVDKKNSLAIFDKDIVRFMKGIINVLEKNIFLKRKKIYGIYKIDL
jgi:hypothetical protein